MSTENPYRKIMSKFFELLSTQTFYNNETGEIFTENIKELVRALENLVNVMGFNPVKTCEDLTDKYAISRLQKLATALIQFYGNQFYGNSEKLFERNRAWIDGRNEASAALCASIVRMSDWNNVPYLVNFDQDEHNMDIETKSLWRTVKTINLQMHRTNLQTAMGLMIYSLSLGGDEYMKIVERLKEDRGEKYYLFPFI